MVMIFTKTIHGINNKDIVLLSYSRCRFRAIWRRQRQKAGGDSTDDTPAPSPHYTGRPAWWRLFRHRTPGVSTMMGLKRQSIIGYRRAALLIVGEH